MEKPPTPYLLLFSASFPTDGRSCTITLRLRTKVDLLLVAFILHRFARTCTRVPSGRVPLNSTTPLRTTPSNSCIAELRLVDGAGGEDARATRPMPLSMAALAKR